VRPTLRRLNDRERYWGMTWPAWAAAAGASGVLYAAIRLSPFGLKPTVTMVVLVLAIVAMVLAGVSGQALSPGRQLRAVVAYRRTPKRWVLGDPDGGGLVLVHAPEVDHDEPDQARCIDPLALSIRPGAL
jgi:hypothetical protein